ncbi:hypothetical protein [Caldicellulosiruptor bescii]|nr:hypothetical protein [Caldicellulosiruptor bescii]
MRSWFLIRVKTVIFSVVQLFSENKVFEIMLFMAKIYGEINF